MRRSFTRTPLACERCRGRKTKCDGVRPRCGHCVRKSAQCIWPTPPVPENSRDTSQQDDVAPTQEISFPDFLAGPETGEASETSQSPATITGEQNLKGLGICLKFFFERHFAVHFCSFAHRPEFEAECKQNVMLAAATIALCGRYLDVNDAQTCFGLPTGLHVARHYMYQARTFCKMKSDQPSVINIQANLILALAELLSSSGSRHWLFAGVAIRMAEVMRLNKDFHQNHSFRNQEIRRRTYWACLMLDRILAYLLAKHRTIDLDTVSIALPDADYALVYQEESRGVTLDSLAEQRIPSDLGIIPYLIKTVCLWSNMTDFAVYSRRRLDPFPPLDPRSNISINHEALKAWRDVLPSSMRWSMDNYRDHKALGHQRSFVASHLLLQTASCVAHQCYLPHLTTYTKLVDLVDAAGWSYLHRDDYMISTCFSAALELGSILSSLVGKGEQSSMQSIWAVSSILITANTFLWLQFAESVDLINEEVRTRAKQYSSLIRDLLQAWASNWKAARQWLAALDIMHDLYKAAYLGKISNHILDLAADPNHQEDDGMEVTDETGDFHPQPGDGYPSVASLPNLQASVKFATGDTSAKSISVQSIWLQLSGGWPLVFTGVDCLVPPPDDESFSEAMNS